MDVTELNAALQTARAEFNASDMQAEDYTKYAARIEVCLKRAEGVSTVGRAFWKSQAANHRNTAAALVGLVEME